jgi:SAM-dependent methyltransferase
MQRQTLSQLREHYEIEKVIADRLRNSTAEERLDLYKWAYDELFQKVTHHPLLAGRSDAERRARTAKEIAALRPFVDKEKVFLEIGPGDCAVSLAIAEFAKNVFAADVSGEVADLLDVPENFEFVIFDGLSLPLPPKSVDVAYSNQLMEHLHPEDSMKQLRSIFATLKPGGLYYCVTPNRLSGPHDVSRSFDAVATGLHLREFTVTELERIFKETGFRKTRIYLRVFKFNMTLPVFPFKIGEAIISPLPHGLRKMLTFNRVVKFVLGIKLLAQK